MQKQVAVKEKNAVQIISGAPSEILHSDIKIPYVILGQGLSDAVVSGDVAVGDIYRSSNKEILGNVHNPVDVVLLHYPQANWITECKPKGSERWKYKGTSPRHAANETLPWSFYADEAGCEFKDEKGNLFQEGDKGALAWRRVKQLRVFAILLSDIKAAADEMKKADKGELPDPSKALTPVVISFRSSSYDAGKDICTFVQRAMTMKQPAFRYVIQMGCVVDKNDEGTFATFKAGTAKPTAVPKEHVAMVEEWAHLVNKSQDTLKTDEEALTQ